MSKGKRAKSGDGIPAPSRNELSDVFSDIKALGAALGVMGAHSDELIAPSIGTAGEIGELIYTLALRGQKALDPRGEV